MIVTSSRQALAGLGISIPVDVFTKEQAAEYLAERTGLADEPGAAQVAEELGCLPLALAQAAAVIAGQRLDYATYLRRLAGIPVADYLTRGEDDPYPRGTAEAIILTVEAAEQRDAGGLCRQLLEVVSLLSPAGSPRTLLTAAAKAPDATVDKALQQLAGWSLVTWSVDGSAVIAHRLVMRVVRERSRHDQTLPAAADRAIATLLSMRPHPENAWRHLDLTEELVQQITALTDHLAPFADVLNNEAMTDFLLLRGWAGWYLTEQKDPSQAIPLLQQVVADRDRLLGPDDRATLTARGNLANAYQFAGRLDEAIPLYERNLADAERLRGPDDPDNLTIRNNLANAYLEAGRLDDAVQRLEQAAADAERLRGPDHPNTLIARNNLANAYREAGRLQQPAWGLRLPPADYAHNDLNLSNILTDGEKITGTVDWDEFGLGSRALDLIVLALDCQQRGAPAAAGRLLARAASAVGSAGLRCLVSYRALAGLAEDTREDQPSQAEIQAISAILDRLQAAGN